MTPEKCAEIEEKKLALKQGLVWLEVKATYPKGHAERSTTTTLPVSVDEARALSKLLMRPAGIVAADLALALHKSEGRKS